MSKKHNTRHEGRATGGYRRRLGKRGLSKAPRMEDLDTLQHRQERREAATGYPWWSETSEADEEAKGSAHALLTAIFTEVEFDEATR